MWVKIWLLARNCKVETVRQGKKRLLFTGEGYTYGKRFSSNHGHLSSYCLCRIHPILHRYTDILLQLHISCEKFQLSGKKFPFLLLEIWWVGGGGRGENHSGRDLESWPNMASCPGREWPGRCDVHLTVMDGLYRLPWQELRWKSSSCWCWTINKCKEPIVILEITHGRPVCYSRGPLPSPPFLALCLTDW